MPDLASSQNITRMSSWRSAATVCTAFYHTGSSGKGEMGAFPSRLLEGAIKGALIRPVVDASGSQTQGIWE